MKGSDYQTRTNLASKQKYENPLKISAVSLENFPSKMDFIEASGITNIPIPNLISF